MVREELGVECLQLFRKLLHAYADVALGHELFTGLFHGYGEEILVKNHLQLVGCWVAEPQVQDSQDGV